MKSSMLCLLLVFSLVFGAEVSLACSCVPSKGPTEGLGQAAAVFSGKVVKKRRHERSEDIFARVEVVLRVERAWKGVEEATVSVFTALHSATCGYGFKEGRTYLVYAHKNAEGKLLTDICSRTRRLKDAREDLKELGTGREITGRASE